MNFTLEIGENDTQLLVDEITTCSCEVPVEVSAVSEFIDGVIR